MCYYIDCLAVSGCSGQAGGVAFKAVTSATLCLQLYRRALKLTKAHEHDVDTATPLEPGRIIRDITATLTLGLTSESAQQLSFRCGTAADSDTLQCAWHVLARLI
jgi:hypothetical protein